MFLFSRYRHFNHPVQPVFEYAVCFFDFYQGKTVCDKRRGINLSRLYQTENLGTIASIHSTGLESQILTIHIGQRKYLRLIIKRHNRNHRIGTGTFPRQAESVSGSCHFQHDISAVQVIEDTHYDNVLWGDDYPHLEGTYGHTQQTLHTIFDGVDDRIRDRVLRGAFEELFGA